MADVTVRAYRKRDRDAILEITRESFDQFCLESNMDKSFGPIAGMAWDARKCDGIAFDLAQNPDHTFVAVVDAQVVGYVCTRLYTAHLIGHVANIAVARKHQGQGIGKLLLAKALEHFRSFGMRYARIETLEQNYKGNRFYPSFGFKEIGRQVFYFREL